MSSSSRNVIIAAALCVAAIFAYVAWTAHDKRVQKQAIAALVAQGSATLARSLQAPPTPAEVAAAQLAAREISAANAPGQAPLARAADQYLSSARVIVQRRAETQQLIEQAAVSRAALAQHVAATARRDDGWIRRATELKRTADRHQADLDRGLNALAELLEATPQVEAALAEHLDRTLLVPEALLASAARDARREATHSAAQLEQARRLAPR